MAVAKETAYSRIIDFENAMCRRRGKSRMERYRFALAYYAGENLPPDNIDQPLGINYIKQVNEKHNHYLWGEWDEDIIGFRAIPLSERNDDKNIADDYTDWCYELCRTNNANNLFFESGLNASIFGDAVIRLRWDPIYEKVVWEQMLPEYCHFRWDVSNLTDVKEVVVAYPMPRPDAKAMYGTGGNPEFFGDRDPSLIGMCTIWEYWTPLVYQIWVDDVPVVNKSNPFIQLKDGQLIPGFIPFIHIPNLRSAGEFYGYSDADHLQLLQDELNRKLADQGDAINNFAHPIVLVRKFYSDVEELPVGPDQIWDLGREGEAEYLQWDGPSPQVQTYIETLFKVFIETASLTPASFGTHQGTQRSGVSLALEMLPVTAHARWKRMVWEERLKDLIQMSAKITDLQHGDLPINLKDLLNHQLTVLWAPILPRDRLALVNENAALFGSHLRSIKKALAEIGESDIEEEHKNIISDLEELSKLGVKIQGFGQAGIGSPSLPEGQGKSDNS